MTSNSGRFKITSKPSGWGGWDVHVEDTQTGNTTDTYALTEDEIGMQAAAAATSILSKAETNLEGVETSYVDVPEPAETGSDETDAEEKAEDVSAGDTEI